MPDYPMAAILSPAQFNHQSDGRVTVTIANPLERSYLGLPPAGTEIPGPGGEHITGPDCVLSINTAGNLEVRRKGTAGGDERATIQNGCVIYRPGGDNPAIPCFPIPAASK